MNLKELIASDSRPLQDALASQGSVFSNLRRAAATVFTRQALGNFIPEDFPDIRFVDKPDTLKISQSSGSDELARKVIYDNGSRSTSGAIYEIHPNELVKAAQARSPEASDLEQYALQYGVNVGRLASIILINEMATVAIESYLTSSGLDVTEELITQTLEYFNNS